MHKHHDEFVAAGARVVAIGLGAAARTTEFRQQLQITYPLLSDPQRVAYRAYGLMQLTPGRAANLRSLARTAKNLLRYGGAVSADQDMAQLGGVFVVDTGGGIRNTFLQRQTYEFPSIPELLEVVAALPCDTIQADE